MARTGKILFAQQIETRLGLRTKTTTCVVVVAPGNKFRFAEPSSSHTSRRLKQEIRQRLQALNGRAILPLDIIHRQSAIGPITSFHRIVTVGDIVRQKVLASAIQGTALSG